MVEGGGERGEIFPRQKTIEFLGGESRSEGESTVEAQSYFEIARLITFISFCFRDIYFCFFVFSTHEKTDKYHLVVLGGNGITV